MNPNESYDTLLKHIYYDEARFGSITATFKEAFQKYKTIILNYVRQWFKSNLETTNQVKGSNSFVVPYPYYEYQLDLAISQNCQIEKLNKVCYVLISSLSSQLLSLSKVINKKTTSWRYS
jgi:hypothetical protein